MIKNGLAEEDNRDAAMWSNLGVGEGKPTYSGQSLDG